MEMQFQATSSEILVQGMMNKGRLMFVDTNPFIPAPDEESLRRKVNAKLRASYKLPDRAMTTNAEAEGNDSKTNCNIDVSFLIAPDLKYLSCYHCSGETNAAPYQHRSSRL